MAFNTKDFRANLKTYAQPNHFSMSFIGPPPGAKITKGGSSPGPNFTEDELRLFDTNFKFRAFATSLPGRNLDTLDRRYTGPSRLIPTGYAYQPLLISILETENHDVRGFFDKWMGYIADGASWFSRYYDDIIVQEMRLELYTRSPWLDSAGGATPVKVYTLKEVYPIAVTATQLDWGSNNNITVINVELQYYIWTSSDPFLGPQKYVPPKQTSKPGDVTRGPYKDSIRGRQGPYKDGQRTLNDDKLPFTSFSPI